MEKSTSVCSLFLAMMASSLLIACVAARDLGKEEGRRPTRKPIAVTITEGKVEVNPYYASAFRGQRVEWYSVDGSLRIELREPKKTYFRQQPRPLQNLTCPNSGCPGYCYVDVPKDQPYGAYPYYVYVTKSGKEYKANQPEVDIGH